MNQSAADAAVPPPPGTPTLAADGYEYVPLRFDSGVPRASSATVLAIHAEFAGWELARVLKFADGSRRVWLRRKPRRGLAPGLIQ